MPITVSCPSCEKQLRVKDELLGKRVKCPSCGGVIAIAANDVPSPQPVPSAPMPPPAPVALSNPPPPITPAPEPVAPPNLPPPVVPTPEPFGGPFYLQAKNGLREVDRAAVENYLATGKLPPDLKAVSIDGGRTFMTALDALQARIPAAEDIEFIAGEAKAPNISARAIAVMVKKKILHYFPAIVKEVKTKVRRHPILLGIVGLVGLCLLGIMIYFHLQPYGITHAGYNAIRNGKNGMTYSQVVSMLDSLPNEANGDPDFNHPNTSPRTWFHLIPNRGYHQITVWFSEGRANEVELKCHYFDCPYYEENGGPCSWHRDKYGYEEKGR